MNKDILPLVNLIAKAIYDKKGMNILAMDVTEVASTADVVIIAEGNVDRHVVAIAREVESAMDEVGYPPLHTEGRSHGDWVVLDFGAIAVHLFMPEMRQRYQLERLWSEGRLLELDLGTKVS
jgi:ribosome-associated protein